MISKFKVRNKFFSSSFSPSTLVEWNKLNSDICNSPSYLTLTFIKPRSNVVLNVSHPKGLIFLTRFRVSLRHLREYKFKHNVLGALIPICICDVDIETLSQFFIHYPRFTNERQNLLPKNGRVIPDIFRKTITTFTSILLFGDTNFSADLKINILNSSIDYILFTIHY